MSQCTAKAKQSGAQCKRGAIAGGTVCNIHGGKSLVGISSPRFSTGRYSSHLPSRLTERYEQSLSDPELLALRDEVSIVDARIADLLSRVDTGESGALWASVKKTFQDWRTAGDLGRQAELLVELEALIMKGNSDYQAWNELGQQIDRRANLAEKEKKRLIETEQMVTVDKLMGLITLTIDIVRTHVTDRNALASIASDLRSRLGPGGAG